MTEYMNQILKEGRVADFPRATTIVPIHPDADYISILQKNFARGSTREVFTLIGRTDVVIKKTIASCPGTNWREYHVSEAARLGKWKQVIGEIHSISESGSYLMMEWLGDLNDDDKRAPLQVPY